MTAAALPPLAAWGYCGACGRDLTDDPADLPVFLSGGAMVCQGCADIFDTAVHEPRTLSSRDEDGDR